MESSSKSNLELLAPLGGSILAIESVPDPVFSQKLIGNGIALDPVTETLVAPCAGRIIQKHPANHAVTLQTDEGVQILLHIGIDTVQLKGEGFFPQVDVGDTVKQGQALIDFDADLIARKAKSLISVMIIAEAPTHILHFASVTRAEGGQTALMQLQFENGGIRATLTSNVSALESVSEPVAIRLGAGLHARPAALIANLAKKFSSDVSIRKNKSVANAKSVVSLLGLDVQLGDQVEVLARGSDADAAVRELLEFIGSMEEKGEASLSKPAANGSSETNPIEFPDRILGVAASPGVVIGRALLVGERQFDYPMDAVDPKQERDKLSEAIQRGQLELDQLLNKMKVSTDAAQAAIFGAHKELLEDPDLLETTYKYISEGRSAAFAWHSATSSYSERLAQSKNELLAHRANDLRDIGQRILAILTGQQGTLDFVHDDAILIARDLTPSDTAQLDRKKILGFCTTTGGASSHVAILARSLGLPAVAGIDPRALEIENGTEVILDGVRGELRLSPSDEEKSRIQTEQRRLALERERALSRAQLPAKTLDGHRVLIAANIGGLTEAREAVKAGCDGVGLLRSEFLFLSRAAAPCEDEQYRIYENIAQTLAPRPLTIRTLDVGGDKPLRYLPLPKEDNPFLGERGIRVSLNHPELFREQIRAILRVRTTGELNVMFPMVTSLDEFRRARDILENEREKLGAPKVHIGIMIEVPSSALMADFFAPEVDFFSIGTNDLAQYVLAMDRGHSRLAKRVDGLHPGVLRLIDHTVRAAHQHSKWVGVCGGIASDPEAVPILIGLGVDELSVSLPVIPLVKEQVRGLNLSDAQELAARALQAATPGDVRKLKIPQSARKQPVEEVGILS